MAAARLRPLPGLAHPAATPFVARIPPIWRDDGRRPFPDDRSRSARRYASRRKGIRMTAVRRALLLSTADRYFTFASNFAVAAAVSRILTPAEIGVSVVGMAILGIALSVRE